MCELILLDIFSLIYFNCTYFTCKSNLLYFFLNRPNMLHKYLIIRFIIYDIVRSNFSSIYGFFYKYASTKEICYLFSYETTFSIVNYFYTKNIVDNSKRRKMIEVCYLQNIRFPQRVDTLYNPTVQSSSLSKSSISQFNMIYTIFTFLKNCLTT